MDEYTISKADLPREHDKVAEFLKDNFFKNLNVVKMFGIEEEPPPDIPDIADFVVKAENGEGRLVGVAFNTARPNNLWSKDKSVRQRQLVEFFEFFEEQAGLHVHEVTDSVELWLLAVRGDWGRRGVARALAAESERVARASGFARITMTCLNEFTRRLAGSLGWRENCRMRYEDYPLLSGREVQLRPTPPHHTLYFCVKNLADDK